MIERSEEKTRERNIVRERECVCVCAHIRVREREGNIEGKRGRWRAPKGHTLN